MKHSLYLRSTLKHVSVYSVGAIAARVVGFLMLPIYTRILLPSDYGVLEILSMTTDLLSFLTAFGLTSAVTRYFYFYDSKEDRSAVVSSAMIMMIAIFMVITAVTLPFAHRLSSLLLGTPDHADFVQLAMLQFLLSSFIEIPFVYLRAKQASKQVVGYSLLRLILTLGLNIWFVVGLRWGVKGVLVSGIISAAAIGGLMFVQTVRETGFALRMPILLQMTRYGAPLIVLNIGSFALHNSDRYFLRAYGTLSEVGIYSLAYRLAMMLPMLVGTPFTQIWTPKALEVERAEQDRAAPVLREILSYYYLVLMTVAFGIAAFGELAVRVLAGHEFAGAARPIPVLCIAMVLFCARSMSQTGAILRERTDLIAISTGLATVAVLGFNFLLIPKFGMMGAAWATVGAFAVDYAVMSAFSTKVYGDLFPLSVLLRPWIAAGVGFGAVQLLLQAGHSLPMLVVAGVVGVLIYSGLLVATGVISGEQRQIIVRGLRNPVNGLRALRGL